MLRWWPSASTRIKVLIALVLVIVGGAVFLAGLAALHSERISGRSTPTITVPPRTLTNTETFPGGASNVVSTLTITEPARTVLITSVITQRSGGDHDNTIAVALISAGALIFGSAITATSAILVARVGKHA
jgi:hypothetical protein